MIICLYEILFNYKNKLKYILFLFIPFFILSYSRTAYLSLIVVSAGLLFIKERTQNVNKKIILVNIIFIGIILFFNTAKEINIYFPSRMRIFLENRLLLPKEKSLTGKRQQHFYYAWLTVLEKPFFGVGPNNLYFSTVKKQFNDEEATTSAHNLILDILAENGILACISFLFFLTFIFTKMKKDLYYYLFLSLSLVFLFNFSYRYVSIFLIWVVLLGISFNNNKNNYEINNKVFVPSLLILFFLTQTIMIGKILNNIGLTDLSLKIYPLNSDGYRRLIKNNIIKKENEKGMKNVRLYNSYYKNSFLTSYDAGRFSEELNDRKSAVDYYKKALYGSPLLSIQLLGKINALNISVFGKEAGKQKTEKFIIKFRKNIIIPQKSDVDKIFYNFCYENNLKCY
jgi:hypothetical protein